METRYSDIQMTSAITEMGLNVVYKYLADRGITMEDIESHGLTIGMAHDIGLTTDERMCVVFPHFDMQGEVIDWWSARLVETGPKTPKGFAALVPVKRFKMYCPAKEPPAAYLDPTLDWTAIEEGSTIYIHESCIKAINGAKCDTYSIGLNGVWGWGSKKHEIALVSQIKDLPWKAKKLRCVVIFDSNAATNDDVALAIRKFAERMRLICGVDVHHHLLPPAPDGKDWGFDDFCAHYGYAHAAEWLANTDDELQVDLSEVETLKLQLNQEVVVVRAIKRVVEQGSGIMMTKAEFCDMNYAHYTAWMERGEGEVQVNVPKLWLTWDRKRMVEKMEYLPGEPPLVDGRYLNLWKGMGCEPASGDVAPWLQLMERNIPDAALRRWVIQWLAYPLQNMGCKMTTYLHLYGPAGTGKQAILAPLMRIYGDNGVTIGREQLASDFNSIYANKQFINADELHGGNGGDGVKLNNKMKRLVTQDTMTVNRKGDPEYMVRNCAHIVTTSNYVDAIKLDDDDRRACVVNFGAGVVPLERDAWLAYFAWAQGAGAQALYHYLLQVDVTGFDPMGWAPMTEAKDLVIRAGRSAVEAWVEDLWEDPTGAIPNGHGKRKVFTIEEIAMWAHGGDPQGVTNAKKLALGTKLTSRGFQRNPQVRVNGKRTSAYVLIDKDRVWDRDEIVTELRKHGVKA